MIGNVLDKYEVIQKLGEGGMATVYRGRHMTLGRDVAIKVLHPHLSSTERNRLRFAREARAIEDMDHENILKIFDYSGSEASSCYIVTEFVDGLTLRELLTDRGRLPSEVATILGIRLSEALSYAHRKKIIHRDLKPENVMVSREGSLKLMDFGIAHFLDEMHLTMTGALVGSPAYMSPEQAMEREDLDHRSDLYSLGTLLFHLTSGQLPFSGTNPSIVLRNIIDGNRPHIMEVAPDISGRFADVIERLLQTDSDDRIYSAAEVAQELQGALSDVGIDPESPAWTLESWLTGPDAYEARLNTHLTATLLAAGKERLEARDHLDALGLFNRLLSIDEGNDEVLTLIQGMHSLHPDDDELPSDERPDRRPWAIALAVPAAAALLTWALWPTPPEPVVNPLPDALVSETVTDPLPPAPTSDNSDPDPIPEPEPAEEPEPDPTGPDTQAASGTPPEPVRTVRQLPYNPRSQFASGEPKELPGSALPDPPPEPEEPGRITVLVPGSYGQVLIDGTSYGINSQLEGAIEVTPGTHELEIINEYALPARQQITVAAGEHRKITVMLQPKPAMVVLDRTGLDGACRVLFDGQPRGTVAELEHVIQVKNPTPRKTHLIELDCPSGRTSRCTVGGLTPGNAAKPDCS